MQNHKKCYFNLVVERNFYYADGLANIKQPICRDFKTKNHINHQFNMFQGDFNRVN